MRAQKAKETYSDKIDELSVKQLRKCLDSALRRIYQAEIIDTGSESEIGENGMYADLDDYMETQIINLLNE